MTKRIITAILILLIAIQQCAFADVVDTEEAKKILEEYLSDHVDMERVYIYDFFEKEESESETLAAGEVLKYPNAVNTVTALGIMSYDDEGNFNEDGAVTFEEFANIMMNINTGIIDTLSERYSEFPKSRYATQNEAAYYLVGILGYDLYDKKYSGENPHTVCAGQIGLFDGLKAEGGKNITRGELAQMIYNSLDIALIEQTVFGKTAEFEKNTESTILSRRFDAVKIEGVVTAQNGIDLYKSNETEENIIKINNAAYSVYDHKINGDFLGKRVIAIAKKYIENNMYELISVEQDANDKSFVIKSQDIVSAAAGNIIYRENENEKKLGLNSMESISINGTCVTPSQFINNINDGFEGEIRVCSTNKGSGYNLVIAFDYQTFKIAGVSQLNEKINIANGILLNGKNYIEYGKNRRIHVYIDGVSSEASNVSAGQIGSVVSSPSGEDILLYVSTNTVEGTVSAADDEKVIIGKNKYAISKAYKSALISDNTLSSIKIRSAGTFLLDTNGRIAGYKADSGDYLFGFMTKFALSNKGLKKPLQLRVFTMENKWETFDTAEYVTVDGVEKLTAEEASKQMEEYRSDIVNTIIRYRLNDEHKIKFLDTVHTSSYEKDDKNSMSMGPIWDDEFNWTVLSTNRITLSNSKYSMKPDAKVFSIPSDLEDESKGFSYGPPKFQTETKGTLQLYNLDDYFVSDIVVNMSNGGTANFEENYDFVIIKGKKVMYDEYSSENEVLVVFDGQSPPVWKERIISLDDSIKDDIDKLEIGDVMLMHTNGSKLMAYKMLSKASDMFIDRSDMNGKYASGTVTAVDVERNLVKVSINGDEYAYDMHSLALYEINSHACSTIEMSDVLVGDRIMCFGGELLMRMLILR